VLSIYFRKCPLFLFGNPDLFVTGQETCYLYILEKSPLFLFGNPDLFVTGQETCYLYILENVPCFFLVTQTYLLLGKRRAIYIF